MPATVARVATPIANAQIDKNRGKVGPGGVVRIKLPRHDEGFRLHIDRSLLHHLRCW